MPALCPRRSHRQNVKRSKKVTKILSLQNISQREPVLGRAGIISGDKDEEISSTKRWGGFDVFYQFKAKVPEFDATFSVQCTLYLCTIRGRGGGRGCVPYSRILASNRPHTVSPKYNDIISLLKSQYLISARMASRDTKTLYKRMWRVKRKTAKYRLHWRYQQNWFRGKRQEEDPAVKHKWL